MRWYELFGLLPRHFIPESLTKVKKTKQKMNTRNFSITKFIPKVLQMFQFADCISSCQIETHAAQKLINRVESHTKMEKRFLFAYETKIFHKQSISHNLIFFFHTDQFKRYNNILQIISI